MRVGEIFNALGGRRAVQGLTGIGPAQISHMFTQQNIPPHWVRLFIALHPELDWGHLLNGNTSEYIDLLRYKPVANVRLARLRTRSKAERSAALAGLESVA